MALDPRLNAYREDLADARLRGRVAASRFVEGRPARVIAGRIPVRRAPAAEAPLDTYYHYGEPVLVFEKAGGWAWCQSLKDGYIGYIDESQGAIGKPAEATHVVATMAMSATSNASRSPSAPRRIPRISSRRWAPMFTPSPI